MSSGLAAVRAQLAERRARAEQTAARFQAAAERLNDGDALTVVDIRCDQRCRSLLAKVYALPEGVLFVSHVEWLPSDQLTLRPWDHDRYLAEERLADLDDDALHRWLEQLDAWAQGLPAQGERWLRDGGLHVVRDVLSEPAGPSGWLPGLWTRCRRHPGHAHAHDRAELLAATRAPIPERGSTLVMRSRCVSMPFI